MGAPLVVLAADGDGARECPRGKYSLAAVSAQQWDEWASRCAVGAAGAVVACGAVVVAGVRRVVGFQLVGQVPCVCIRLVVHPC